jgi:hypothetical protein
MRQQSQLGQQLGVFRTDAMNGGERSGNGRIGGHGRERNYQPLEAAEITKGIFLSIPSQKSGTTS